MNKGVVVRNDGLQLLVEAAQDYCIFLLDVDGAIACWNPGVQRVMGYASQEVIGKDVAILYSPEASAIGWPAEELLHAKEEGRFEREGWRMRKDGTRFWANVVTTATVDEYGILTGFGTVTRDLTERCQLDDLERSSQRMPEFLAMLAHELRNPLAPMRNAVTLLQLEPAPSTIVKSGRDMIDRQLSHLTRLVDELLEVGRLTTGKITLQTEQLDYAEIVAKCVEAQRSVLEGRHHRLKVDVPQCRVWVLADAMRVTQVLQNLLTNAAQFTPEGGDIRLAVWVDGDQLYTSVADTGVGMSSESLDSIFTLFSQVKGATNRQSGLGIGLTLAKSLVELHGGTVHASSAGLGLGSTFTFVLPGAQQVARQDAFEAKKFVLVCDDNRDSADSLSEVLRMLGFQVFTAYDGAGAERAVRGNQPCAAFLDLSMPDTTGYELLKRLAVVPGAEGMRSFAVTGYGSDADKQRSKAAGFTDHLTKPVELDRLRQALADANLV